MEPSGAPERPWAAGIGLVVLGLAVSAIVNGATLGDPTPAARVAGMVGWSAGVFVAGAGVHRLLWFRPTSLGRAPRLVVTALVTPLAFAGGAVFFSVLFSILQRRFMS